MARSFAINQAATTAQRVTPDLMNCELSSCISQESQVLLVSGDVSRLPLLSSINKMISLPQLKFMRYLAVP